jgi:hypothetical protein
LFVCVCLQQRRERAPRVAPLLCSPAAAPKPKARNVGRRERSGPLGSGPLV